MNHPSSALVAQDTHPAPRRLPASRWRAPLLVGVALLAWAVAYATLVRVSLWVAQDLLHLALDTRFGSAIAFFLYETPKVLLLLCLVVFGVGILRSFFSPERTRKLLAGRREVKHPKSYYRTA